MVATTVKIFAAAVRIWNLGHNQTGLVGRWNSPSGVSNKAKGQCWA